MPEFFGNTAYYYEARNGRSLAERLTEALAVPESIQREKRRASEERALAYTWQTTANRTVEQLLLATGEVIP